MKEYKRFTARTTNGYTLFNCIDCSRKALCRNYSLELCGLESIERLSKLEDLIDAGKLIFVDADDDGMVQIKVSRSWLKEMHKILQEKDIDC